jgi:hypothetical protein
MVLTIQSTRPVGNPKPEGERVRHYCQRIGWAMFIEKIYVSREGQPDFGVMIGKSG